MYHSVTLGVYLLWAEKALWLLRPYIRDLQRALAFINGAELRMTLNYGNIIQPSLVFIIGWP
jgi:hypothetical protein